MSECISWKGAVVLRSDGPGTVCLDLAKMQGWQWNFLGAGGMRWPSSNMVVLCHKAAGQTWPKAACQCSNV